MTSGKKEQEVLVTLDRRDGLPAGGADGCEQGVVVRHAVDLVVHVHRERDSVLERSQAFQ